MQEGSHPNEQIRSVQEPYLLALRDFMEANNQAGRFDDILSQPPGGAREQQAAPPQQTPLHALPPQRNRRGWGPTAQHRSDRHRRRCGSSTPQKVFQWGTCNRPLVMHAVFTRLHSSVILTAPYIAIYAVTYIQIGRVKLYCNSIDHIYLVNMVV